MEIETQLSPNEHDAFIRQVPRSRSISGPHHCCFNTELAITTACIRTSMASMSSPYRSLFFSPNPEETSLAASLYSQSSVLVCSHVLRLFLSGKGTR